MVVTCASCLTKFNLDDSKIPAKGVKVRCSRCQHVFYVVPPPETKEEIIEDFESFAKYHEELMGPEQGEQTQTPQPPEAGATTMGPRKEVPLQRVEPAALGGLKEGRAEAIALKTKKLVMTERKKSRSLWFAVFVILIVLIFGIFMVWTELGQGGRLSPYVEYPVKKIIDFWRHLWGV